MSPTHTHAGSDDSKITNAFDSAHQSPYAQCTSMRCRKREPTDHRNQETGNQDGAETRKDSAEHGNAKLEIQTPTIRKIRWRSLPSYWSQESNGAAAGPVRPQAEKLEPKTVT